MQLNYRPELDGLRALAIVPVLIFHFGASWMPGGYLGVDVFFVISGYLIGSILLREMDEGTFRFRAFWMRRIRRIAPALLAVTLATLLVSLVVSFPPYLATIGSDSLASTFSSTNFAMLLKSGNYWEPEATASPFLHTWSLSVEEQFYLLFPGFLFLLRKLRWRVPVALSILATASLFLFVILTVYKPRLAFYLLPARGWELAVGGLVASFPLKVFDAIPRLWRTVIVWASTTLMLGSYFLVSGDDSFSAAAIFPVLGSVGILVAARQEGLGKWLFSNAAAVSVGKVSYSLYLWHWPVLVLSQAFEARFQTVVPWWTTLSIAVLLSVVSYFLIENPLRRRKKFWVPFFLLLVPVLALGSYLWLSPPRVLDTSSYSRKTTSAEYDLSPSRQHPTAYKENGVLVGTLALPPRIVVIGDSHAAIWGATLDAVGKELDTSIALFALTSNRPFFPIPLGGTLEAGPPKWTSGQKMVYAQNLLQKLDTWRPAVVVLACRWDNYNEKGLQGAVQLVEYCENRGIKIVLFEQAPSFEFGNFEADQYLAYIGLAPQEGKEVLLNRSLRGKVEAANERAARLLAKGPGATVIRLGDTLNRGEEAVILSGRKVLYRDDDHLSDWGTELFHSAIVKTLGPLLSPGLVRP